MDIRSVPAAAGSTASTGQSAEDKKLRKACRDMEAVFLNMLLSKMRDTVPKDSLLGDNNKRDILQSMLDSQLTQNMADSGGTGIADMMYRQLSQTSRPQVKNPTSN